MGRGLKKGAGLKGWGALGRGLTGRGSMRRGLKGLASMGAGLKGEGLRRWSLMGMVSPPPHLHGSPLGAQGWATSGQRGSQPHVYPDWLPGGHHPDPIGCHRPHPLAASLEEDPGEGEWGSQRGEAGLGSPASVTG